MKIAIKIQSKKVSRTFKPKDFPVKIGRAAINDLIINEPAISAQHAILEIRDDKYFLRDIGSRNGLSINGQKETDIELRNGKVVLIGDVELSIVDIDRENLEKTREIDPPLRLKQELRQIWIQAKDLLPIFAILAVIEAITFYLDWGRREEWIDILKAIFSVTGSILFLSGAFSLYAKLHSGRYQVVAMIRLTMILIIASQILFGFAKVLNFFFFREWMMDIYYLLVGTAYLGLFAHLMAGTIFVTTKRTKVFAWTFGIVATLVVIGLSFRLIDQDKSSGFELEAKLGYPLFSSWPGTVSVASLVDNAIEHSKKIDEHRIEALKERKQNNAE